MRNPLKFAVVPQTCQPISATSGPNFTILCEHMEEILLFNKFSQLSIHALVAKIQPNKLVRSCADGDFCLTFVSCIFSEPRAAHCRPTI